jgi:hypothetical protein
MAAADESTDATPEQIGSWVSTFFIQCAKSQGILREYATGTPAQLDEWRETVTQLSPILPTKKQEACIEWVKSPDRTLAELKDAAPKMAVQTVNDEPEPAPNPQVKEAKENLNQTGFDVEDVPEAPRGTYDDKFDDNDIPF